MAWAFNGTTSYLGIASSIVTPYPVTMVAWFNPSNITASQDIMSIGNSVGTQQIMALNAAGAVTGDPLRVNTRGETGGVLGVTDTAVPFSAGVWQHAAAVFVSASERSVLLNGGNKATTTNTVSAMTLNAAAIGRRVNVLTSALTGSLAEAAIWSAALTDEEIASLAKGFSPALIRPQSLAFYAPLARNLIDVRGGITITNSNAAVGTDHPPIFYRK